MPEMPTFTRDEVASIQTHSSTVTHHFSFMLARGQLALLLRKCSNQIRV